MAAQTKIIPLTQWRRDGTYYDMSGQGQFLLQARNVVPTDGGYTGPPNFVLFEDLDIGGTTWGANGDYIDSAIATENSIYASLVVAGGADMLIRGDETFGSPEDATGASGWTGDLFGASFAQYGDFVIATNENQRVQYIDDTSATGTNFSDLIVTTAPTGSSFATADLRAKFAFPYRDHMVLANCTLVADYPSVNPIYTGNATVANAKVYGSLVWISMMDNIRRYASPTVHPEVKGSIPLNLEDSSGSITGAIGGESAYIFKQDAVYQLVGPPFDAVRIADGTGTVAPCSIIKVNNQIYFLSNHGPAVIEGNNVTVLGHERFMNALTNQRHQSEVTAGWTGPTSGQAMLGNLLQTESQLQRTRVMYSDTLGCVIWYLRSGRWIACRVNGSGDMSFGNTGDFFNGGDVVNVFTATARMPNWLTNSASNRNIAFRAAIAASNVKVSYAFEDYSGFDGVIRPPSGAYHFTLPMMPYAMDETGILTTRLTGFRVIGEAHRNVRVTFVRTQVGWNQEPVITDRFGTKLQSQDGWVNLPNTYAGKFHSLSFMMYDDVEESVYLRRPFFSGVEVRFENAVGRGA